MRSKEIHVDYKVEEVNQISINSLLSKKHYDLIISLAEHCWLNEYLFIKSEKEIDIVNKLKRKIENDKGIDELQISILG